MLNEIDLAQKALCLGDAIKNKEWNENSSKSVYFKAMCYLLDKSKKLLK